MSQVAAAVAVPQTLVERRALLALRALLHRVSNLLEQQAAAAAAAVAQAQVQGVMVAQVP